MRIAHGPPRPHAALVRGDSIALGIEVVTRCGIMIHRPAFSRQTRTLAALAALATLSACAHSTRYPSFAIPAATEEAGRVAMRFPGVTVPEPRVLDPEPTALPSELDAALAAINARARAAARDFSASLGPVRNLARLAAGSAPESDRWTSAQIGLAELVSHHSAADLALADLDELAARAALSQSAANEAAEIAQVRASLAPMVEEQARALAGINAELSR